MRPNPPNILKEIVSAKRREVERLMVEAPISLLEGRIEKQKPALDFAGALRGDGVRIIAEIKKASPSRGLLRPDFDPVSLAATYAENGAAAISVLTNADYFQGSIEHLEAVHGEVNPRGIPVLRKEFIFDRYQVHEARAYGADAILLIVAVLSSESLRELRELAERLRMQSLIEVHDEDELETALEAGAAIIGINNRDLRTFKTDLEVTERLAPLVPGGKMIVSESGIHNRHDIRRIQRAGANAALIGEALVTAPSVGATLRGLT